MDNVTNTDHVINSCTKTRVLFNAHSYIMLLFHNSNIAMCMLHAKYSLAPS